MSAWLEIRSLVRAMAGLLTQATKKRCPRPDYGTTSETDREIAGAISRLGRARGLMASYPGRLMANVRNGWKADLELLRQINVL